MSIDPRRSSADERRSEEAFVDSTPSPASTCRYHSVSRAWLHLQRLGVPSLGSLLFGGAILIFVALNVLAGSTNSTDEYTFFHGVRMESYKLKYRAQPPTIGSSWSIQAWVAITGVGFGLVSHGLREASEHMFEWWSSRQARSAQGLDYARYLNTQSRAPVAYGVRGFVIFATVRYVLLAASITMSIGYKFGFHEVNILVRETGDYRNLSQNGYVHDPEDRYRREIDRPWLTDFPCDSETRQFSPILFTVPENPDFITTAEDLRDSSLLLDTEHPLYSFCNPDIPANATPYGVIMASAIDASYEWGSSLTGHMVTREMVLLANTKAEEEEEEELRMHREEENGWFRTVSASTHWVNQTGAGVVIEFRLPHPGTVQIRWAEAGSWLTNESSPIDSVPVAFRITYRVQYGVAEVTRVFSASTREGLEAHVRNQAVRGSIRPRVLSVDDAPISVKARDGAIARRMHWVAGLLSGEHTSILDGTSAILRAAMVGWAESHGSIRVEEEPDRKEKSLRLLTTSHEPFGPENRTSSRRARELSDLEYPIIYGTRLGTTGCYIPAAGTFLAIGIISVMTIVVRIWVGPAELTSWTAQHIYLSQIGLLPSLTASHELQSGYEVASSEKLGFLRLRVPLVQKST